MAHCFIFRFAIAVGQNNPSDFVMQKKKRIRSVLCCMVVRCLLLSNDSDELSPRVVGW